MSITTWSRHRADAPAGWQPIGLPTQDDVVVPAAFVRRDAGPAVRRAIRTIAGPAAALTASVAVVSMTAAVPSAQGATPVSALLADSGSPSATVSTPSASVSTPQTAVPQTATPQTATPQTQTPTTTSQTPQATDPQVGADPKGLLPALPNLSDAIPNVDGNTDKNVWTPGQPSAAGGASYSTPSTAAPTPGTHTASGDVYPGQPDTFNDSAEGWSGYQEYSPWCWSRGVTCVNWNFSHETTGGPNGAGDGFLRVNGTSLGVAPCVPNTGVGRWVSPEFTYDTNNAKGWNIDFDFRTTALVAGDGHATFSIQILDSDGRVVTTAHGPQAVEPTNHWDHISNGFDGSKLVFGKQYRISIMVDVVHAETALTWGNLDFDNIKMTAQPGPQSDGNGPSGDGVGASPADSTIPDGLTPYTVCRPGDAGIQTFTELLTARPQDLCPLTNAAGQAGSPLLDVAEQAMSQPSVSNLLDKGSGIFAVLNLQTGDFLGFVAGRESLPSTDPRDLVAYLKDGGVGEVGNYALVFVTDNASLIPNLAKNPVPAVSDIVQGQIGNATQLLSDPGRLTRLPLDWQVGNAKWMLQTILNPIVNQQDRDTELGGTVWDDANKNGALDPGEKGVPGVKVELNDRNGNSYGTAITGPDGRYVFTHVTPRTDPSDYYITFAPDSLPSGSSFTTEHAPGTVHGTTSDADQQTGKTDRIRITRYQKDLNWDAGLVNVPGDKVGSEPGTAEPGTTEGTPTLSNPLNGILGSGSDQPTGSDQTSSGNPLSGVLGSLTSQLPGTSTPGSDQPTGSDQPSSKQPSSDQPTQSSDQLSFKVGAPKVNNTDAAVAPGPVVKSGSQVTVSVPVTNTGDTPISDVKAQFPGQDGAYTMTCSSAAIQPGQTATCQIPLTAQNGQVNQPINIVGTSDDGEQMTKLCRIHYQGQEGSGRVALTGQFTANGKPVGLGSQAALSGGQSTLAIQVTNTGNAPLTSLSAQSQTGSVTCDKSSLAPGEKATCTVTFTPKAGSNSFKVNFAGKDALGNSSTATFTFAYTFSGAETAQSAPSQS